jgi:peptidoglycan/LPS O-acetylase OafA/YrhL
MKEDRPELRPLTAFRFFAALAVFFRHVYPWLNEKGNLPGWLGDCFHDGFSGVTFFFILSGFILTYNYRFTFDRLTMPKVWSFFAARLARIGPVHVLTFLIALPLVYRSLFSDPIHSLERAAVNLTLTQSFFSDESIYFSFNSVSWSLSDEMFFYALLPLILWGLQASGWDRPRHALALAIGTWLLAMTLVITGLEHPRAFWLWYVNPLFRVLDFLVGVALGHLFLGLRESRLARINAKWATTFELASLGLIAASLAANSFVPYLLRRSVYYTPCFGCVILVFAFQRGLISRLLSGNVLRVLGEVSFSFYMFHYLLIRMVDQFPNVTHLGHLSPIVRSAAVFAVSLAVSYGCWRWYEMPARERVKRWLLLRGSPIRTGVRMAGVHPPRSVL